MEQGRQLLQLLLPDWAGARAAAAVFALELVPESPRKQVFARAESRGIGTRKEIGGGGSDTGMEGACGMGVRNRWERQALGAEPGVVGHGGRGLALWGQTAGGCDRGAGE